MKKKYTNMYIVFISIISFAAFPFVTFGSVIQLAPSKEIVGTEEQFYVDVILDTQGKEINALEGKVQYPRDTVSFVRAEEGKSIINLWIENPLSTDDTVTFAGIISNGFSGVIDPFNPHVKLPGPILRLVFEAKKPSAVTFKPSFVITLNDGEGTKEETTYKASGVTIEDRITSILYKNNSQSVPIITETYVVQDKNLYDNKYTLIFQATDKGSGIKEVTIKEGSGEWKKGTSPYLLEDQRRHSIITIQAINFNGERTMRVIDALPRSPLSRAGTLMVVGMILMLGAIVRWLYVKKQFKKK